MGWAISMETRSDGLIKLSDGTVLKLKVFIVDIKEAGFSQYGGVNFDVSIVGGVSTQNVPEELKKAVASNPLAPPTTPDRWLGDRGYR